MTIALVIGLLIGFFIPDLKINDETTIFKYLSNLIINSLLYLTLLYILVKVFLSIIYMINKKITKQVLSTFLFFIVISLIASILISVIIMNIGILKPVVSVIEQHKDKKLDTTSLTGLINHIINDNIFKTFQGSTNLLFPIIFVSIIFAVSAYFSEKKGQYFIDSIVSFDHVLDLIVRQFLEIFAFGAIFIFASLVKIDFFSSNKLQILLKPLYAIIIASTLIIIIYFIILYIFFKKKAFNFLMSILGSSLISFATGNSAASIIPVSEHLKSNAGVNKNLTETLTPLGMIINKSGTVIISTITLFSLILILTPDRLAINLQLLLILFIFLFSFIQDGAGSNAFLIIVVSILKINFLHLEEDSYLLFYASIPLFSRIATFLDSLSTSIFIMLTAKFTNNLEEVKYIDYI